MHRQGYDLQLTQYDDRGWRATFYPTGMEHNPAGAIGTSWERVNITPLGAFNPRIFQPAWFANHGLIRQEEAANAERVLAVKELATFAVDWLSLQVTPDRLQAQTTDHAHYEVLRDLVLGTFRILEHTPVEKMGINRNMHYRVTPDDKYVAFGHFLVPKQPWADILEDPRTMSLSVAGLQRRGSDSVKMTVKIEPSVRVRPGVFISTNEHYESETPDGTAVLLASLERNWDAAMANAEEIAEHLLHQEY